eukprot:TRINITY_DN792_c0_g1_i2.p1 TRINITY_DN792_c0_g1~~TRINITY_DN792_c0_g1_i2.p1  ORF type:complete len:140 (+),score=23.51 TRINITY_DN792_c0_g1_i2:80-499(+)
MGINEELDVKVREKVSKREWSRVVLFDQSGNVLSSSFELNDPSQLLPLLGVFNEKEKTLANGIDFLGRHYDIHRYYEGLAYGRTEETSDKGQGIAIHRTETPTSKKVVYGLVTFDFPIITARAVSQLSEFLPQVASLLE